jgi:hypothetical protein
MAFYALYYPTIEFHDIDFLKKSILVWDRIFRIVPASYDPYDNEEVKEAIDAGIVIDLYLKNDEKNIAGTNFLNFYEQLKRSKEGLAMPSGFSSHSFDDFARIHPEKTDVRLQSLFQEMSSKLDKLADGGFIKIPRYIAGIYMFYLSKVVAEKRDLNLLTDSNDSWIAGTYFSQEGNFNKDIRFSMDDVYLCNLAIDGLLPSNLSGIPMENLIKFKEKHKDERIEFQKSLDGLKKEISKCENKEHAKDIIVGDFIKNFEVAKSEYKKTIAFFNKIDMYSLIFTGIPVAGALLSSNPFYDPMKFSKELLLWGVSALAYSKLIPKTKGVPSYLIDAEKLAINGKYPNYKTIKDKSLHERFNDLMND